MRWLKRRDGIAAIIALVGEPDPKTGCREWQGGRDKDGYGKTMLWGRPISAHRASYLLNIGPIPDGLDVLHRCDNPPCVEPTHLFTGTNMDNIRDRDSKKRQACGVGNGGAKLSASNVAEIRATYTGAYGEASAFAKKYGVSRSCIWRVVTGRHWQAAP